MKHKKEEYDYNYNEWTGIKNHLQNGNYKEWSNGNSRIEYWSVQIKHSPGKTDRGLKTALKKDQWTWR